MKISLFILVMLFASMSANSQTMFPDVFERLKNSDGAKVICDTSDAVQKRILYEYGAVYVSTVFSAKNAKLPARCILTNNEVDDFMKSFKIPANKPVFGNFYLQPKAKEALEKVFRELGGYKFVARNCNGTTTCTDGINDDWAVRDFRQTMCNWTNSSQCNRKKISEKDTAKLLSDTYFKQTKPYSAQAPNRPVIFRAALPGSSQHHLGLAIDVNNGTGNSDVEDCKKSKNCLVCGDKCVNALEKHGWFRTVKYDPYHFTFLGFSRDELPDKGLKQVVCKDGKKYWVPNVKNYHEYPNWRCRNVSK